ncbi:choice-of-anchor D domain-containing protein [Tenacibaculum sp. A30]|uniref:choice-of-anchor D domain-containing protein n=1 Tax=Tenacibaculum sp. A30 TaxID=3442644 RepID=UPI003EB831D5
MRKKITMYAGAILFVLASITSCDKDEEIIPAVFSIDQIEKDFGTVEVEQSTSYSFEVTNKGEADLEIDEFVIKGTDAADFSTSAVPKVIRKGEAYSFEITFAPLTEGNKEAILEITTNIGKKEVTVTGVAEPKPLPTVDLNVTTLSFGDVEINQTDDATFTITNSGDADLEITAFEVKGTNASEFTTAATAETLAVGGTKTVSVTFAPTTEGNKTASLEITTNVGVKIIALDGKGTAVAQPVMTFSESPIAFGNVEVGQELSKTITVSNTGNADLEITNVNIVGSSTASSFTVIGGTTALIKTIAPGDTHTFEVKFMPSSQGYVSASIRFLNNSNDSDVFLGMNGTGTAPAQPVMTFSESPIVFGNVEVGQELSKNITISNTGNADLDITNVNIVGGSTASSFTVIGGTSSLIRTIAPGDTYTFEVKFTPSSQGFASASIRFFNNSSENKVSLPMNGTGTAPAQPAIAFSETGLGFGDVTVGNSGNDLTFAIQNNGQGNLEVSNIRMSGLNASDFTLVNVSAPQTIAPGSFYEVTARFTPQSAGQKQAMIVVESNDPTKPSYAILINGTGI